MTHAHSAVFEVVHKSLHAVKLGRELRQVVFQRVELPVEVPHGVRQGPDPGKEICDSHARLGLSMNSDKPEHQGNRWNKNMWMWKHEITKSHHFWPQTIFFLIICEEKSP